MPTVKTDTIELIYKAFQENPTRLTYSTEKLQKQFNASQEEVKKARNLYRLNSKDFIVAQAMNINNTIPESELFETLTGERKGKVKKSKILLHHTDSVNQPINYLEWLMNKQKEEFSDDWKKQLEEFFVTGTTSIHIPAESDQWEVKQKWVKNKETGESSLMVRKPNQDIEELGKRLISEMKQYSPKYNTVKREQQKDGHLLVISLSDLHIGKYAVAFETGQDYNRKIAIERTLEGVEEIVKKSSGFNIDTILLIIGNDILHSDTKQGTTTKGTSLDTEGLWHENFLLAKELCVKVIEMLVPIADVYVQNNMSNHDYLSGFFLADTIRTWFRLNENVTFDISPKSRKYFQYGNNLIGTSHGDTCKEEQLPLIMAEEASQEWAESKHRYWFLHHIHHKKSKEYGSVCVEYSRSPSSADGWHDSMGFVNKPALDGFIHSLEKGQVARITHYFE